MRGKKAQRLTFEEKDFYLEEFHDKSLLFALHAADLLPETHLEAVAEVCGTLLANETRVLLLIETSGAEGEHRRVKALGKQLIRAAKLPEPFPAALPVSGEEDQLLTRVWAVLRESPLFVGLWPTTSGGSLLTCAQHVAVRLQVYKLVFLDEAGGVTAGGGRLSFMNGPVLRELLRPGEAEWAELSARRPLLTAIHAALEGGIPSVSLCPPAGLGRELLTYEGCGTLFTQTDYCQVAPLGIDDFLEVERLLQRGEREGHLKPRSAEETALLLLHGYGARLGPAPGQLAGFCALLPYRDENTAEVTGLSTITRYQGEGIGGRLIAHAVAEGEQRGLPYIFACTNQEPAQRLFERHGFSRVPPEAVAAAKWEGYDPVRKQQIAVYRRELSPPGQRPV